MQQIGTRNELYSQQKKTKKKNKATSAKDHMNANIRKKLRPTPIKVQSRATLFITELSPSDTRTDHLSAAAACLNTNLCEPRLVKMAQMPCAAISVPSHLGLPSCSTLQGDKWPRLAFSTAAQTPPRILTKALSIIKSPAKLLPRN